MVIGQDAQGNLTLRDRDEALELGGQRASGDELMADDSEDASECVICLEPFGLWDEVAWSNRQGCKHVWHAECIRSWLQDSSHDDCPSCRSIILEKKPVDSQADPEMVPLEEALVTDDDETSISSPATNDTEGDVEFVILRGQDSIGVAC